MEQWDHKGEAEVLKRAREEYDFGKASFDWDAEHTALLNGYDPLA